ncbi:MAG: hypothetical protein ACTHMC_28975 [Pseudobacter sp.]|uniref:hypothetical protein n=1 Tax=Pseudobacter sp. TaxID=2045420 RepID=UPI003F7D78F8
MRRILILVAGAMCVLSHQTKAQCTFPAGTPNGACTGTPATDGVNINAGQTYSYTGTATTFSGVNLNGGTLQVCGTLTISNINFNGGAIVVMSGGSLTLNTGINLNTGSLVTNHGTITVNGSLNVGGTDGAFINYGVANVNGQFSLGSTTADLVNGAPTAVFNAPGQTVNLSGEMKNLGVMNVGTITVNGGSDVCLGPGSQVNTGTLNNNDPNGIVVRPTGSMACVRYTGNALLNSFLSSDATLQVCQATGSTVSGAGGFGAATVTANCGSCAVALPVVLEYFRALVAGSRINVEWESSSEDNVDGYVLEGSGDGNSFSKLAYVEARNEPSKYLYDIPAVPEIYLRLRMEDRDGSSSYSKIIYVKTDDAGENNLLVLNNPAQGDQVFLRIISTEEQQGRLIFRNVSGQVVKDVAMKLQSGQQDVNVAVTGLQSGLYTVVFIGNRNRIGPFRFIRKMRW